MPCRRPEPGTRSEYTTSERQRYARARFREGHLSLLYSGNASLEISYVQRNREGNRRYTNDHNDVSFGRVPEFNDNSEEFELYLIRFERWLVARDFANTKKSDILVSSLPARTYALLKTLPSSKAVTEST